MSGSPGDVGNILAQALEMQKSIKKAQAELDGLRVAGSAGGGAVQIEVDGHGSAKSVRISNEALSGGRSMVEDMVLAALDDAQSRAKRDREERMGKVTGGLKLPGLG